MRSIFSELKRRNVFRVGIAYAITAWLILQLSDIVLDNIQAPHWVMQAIMLLLAIGLPLALVFAWAFELTPDGLKKEKDVDRTQSITHQTGHKLDRTIIVILVLALGYFAYDKFGAGSEKGSEPFLTEQASSTVDSDATKRALTPLKSLAVLPFVDMSPAKDNEYFTDGLTEELLNILAQIKGLQVAGRTSSFAFKNKTEDLREIGSKLNVNTLLEGSVRKDDKRQRIRVTVQLINVADGYHIWSDTYDRDIEDIFAIQEDIAQQVADALKINLLGEEEKQIAAPARTGMNAYDLYLQGLQNVNSYSFESLRKSESQLTESLAIDPGYLPTKLALARMWIAQADTGATPAPEAFAKANPLLDEVLAEDPGNSDAHGYRGRIQDYQENYAAARVSFQHALESNPRNAIALTNYGRFLFDRGEVEEGLAQLHEAARIEPYDTTVQWELCMTQALLVDVTAGTRECERIGEIQPDNPMQYYGQGYMHMFRGELAQFLYWRNKASEADPADPELPAGGALVWLDIGDTERAEADLQKAASLDPDHPFTLAARIELLLYQEQYQQAVSLAQKARDEKLPGRQGSDDIIDGLLLNDAVRRRDYATALAILQEGFPDGLASPLDTDDVDDVYALAGLAYVLKMQNPAAEQVPALLDHADVLNKRSDGRVFPSEKPFRQAMIESARGDKVAALSSLHEAFEKGWRLGWRDWMYRDFQFESLHNEPEYKNLVAMFEADMEKQHEEAYELLGLKK